jgi:hypothetical protein
VPNGNDAFQYAKGRTEEGGSVAVYRRRADERGSYGGWRWEADTGKLIAQGAKADEASKPTAEGGKQNGEGGKPAVKVASKMAKVVSWRASMATHHSRSRSSGQQKKLAARSSIRAVILRLLRASLRLAMPYMPG